MQSLSLKLSKRLSNSSHPHWRISSNFIAHASTTSSSPSPPSPPISAAANATTTASTLNNLLTAPWSASQTRGFTFSGSDVSVNHFFNCMGLFNFEIVSLWFDSSIVIWDCFFFNFRLELEISLKIEVVFFFFFFNYSVLLQLFNLLWF